MKTASIHNFFTILIVLLCSVFTLFAKDNPPLSGNYVEVRSIVSEPDFIDCDKSHIYDVFSNVAKKLKYPRLVSYNQVFKDDNLTWLKNLEINRNDTIYIFVQVYEHSDYKESTFNGIAFCGKSDAVFCSEYPEESEKILSSFLRAMKRRNPFKLNDIDKVYETHRCSDYIIDDTPKYDHLAIRIVIRNDKIKQVTGYFTYEIYKDFGENSSSRKR